MGYPGTIHGNCTTRQFMGVKPDGTYDQVLPAAAYPIRLNVVLGSAEYLSLLGYMKRAYRRHAA